MPARIEGPEAVIDDRTEASQIHNRGWFGDPQSGGGLRLDLVEALYLVETDRLEVVDGRGAMDFIRLLRLGNRTVPKFEIKYLVYRDLRARGYVVKGNCGPADFRVLPRGGRPSKSTSKWWVLAISERSLFSLEELLSSLETCSNLRRALLLAVVDEEGDVTYYEVSKANPSGRQRSPPKERIAEGFFTGDRVIVPEPTEAAALQKDHFFGKLLGSKLQLSLIEAAYLLELGALTLRNARTGRAVTIEQLIRHARRNQPDFDLRLRAYQDLKGRGMVVKTGFKYGSHFRAYEGDPNKMHARILMHAVPQGYSASWAEISRAIRLAHGVRKEILFGRIGEEQIGYLRLSRCRP